MDMINTVLTVGDNITRTLQCYELANMFLNFGFKSDLDEFQQTVERITAILRDAEKKQPQELSHETLDQIEKLKDVFYEADDLLDEFATRAQQQRLMDSDATLLEKVRRFFSLSNPICVSYSMNRGIKNFKKKLDAIAYNKQFSIEIDHEPIRKRSRETCSYMDEVEIIGRGDDLEKIVGMLLDCNVQCDVSFLSIVGIGGLGKTALAQLVFNDPRVTSAFPLSVWTCVSDQDQKVLDVKKILCKILGKGHESCQLDEVQKQLREQLAGNRFLLVLDDVWTENRYQWGELEKFLTRGQRGSWIVVTTRSQETASIVRDGQVYELQGLSKEDSRRLFEKIASPSGDLVEIGEEIIKGCAGVPLAIRVLGSLLYGQEKSRWEFVQKIGLLGLRESKNGIIPILELSYHHLESPLKSCFSYCALFPKDYRIKKEMLTSLWLAQGYIVPLEVGQSIEDASEEYFSILLRRCFFQDIEYDEVGETISSVKIHDLMHDIAQKVSRKEIYCAMNDNNMGRLVKRVRHASSFGSSGNVIHALCNTQVRSFVFYRLCDRNPDDSFLETLLASCRSLRALHLNYSTISRVPNSINNLLHLRYLVLYSKDLQEVPDSVTKLCNLQYLDFNKCKIKKLPRDLSRLVNLRVLIIGSCVLEEFIDSCSLRYMPRGMNKLNCLSRLDRFVVGREESCLNWNEWFIGLEELRALTKLKGKLTIDIKWPGPGTNIVENEYVRKELYLMNLEHLIHIGIAFGFEWRNGIRIDDEGEIALMEDLHPPPNLKKLDVNEYQGSRMPDWISLLQHLVSLRLDGCWKLEYLPLFGSEKQDSFLPCLEKLSLVCLPELKGWRRGGVRLEDSSSWQYQVPHLSQLKELQIRNCPELTLIPVCPKLEKLDLKEFNTSLQGVMNTGENASILMEIKIDNVGWLKSMPMKAFQHLEILRIGSDRECENLGDVEDVFSCCSSSLRKLEIENCNKLTSVVGGGLEYLTALEQLHIIDCGKVKLSEQEEKEGEADDTPCPSTSLLPSLRTINLSHLPKLEYLPNWMQFLPALQFLSISKCHELKGMPNWMPKLTSLKELQVCYCLKRVETSFLQHIPNIHFQRCL